MDDSAQENHLDVTINLLARILAIQKTFIKDEFLDAYLNRVSAYEDILHSLIKKDGGNGLDSLNDFLRSSLN